MQPDQWMSRSTFAAMNDHDLAAFIAARHGGVNSGRAEREMRKRVAKGLIAPNRP
jgi:hypothetical protein